MNNKTNAQNTFLVLAVAGKFGCVFLHFSSSVEGLIF